MVAMRSLACLLLVSALVSGCSDAPMPASDNPPSEPLVNEQASGSGDAPADAPDPPASGDAASPEATAAAPDQPAPALKVVEVSEDGVLAPAAGAPDQGMFGANALPVGGLHDRWFSQDIPGTVVAADLTMTWTPAPGASTELRLTFSPVERSDGFEQMTDERRDVEGTSPLRLQLEGLGWDEGAYTVAAWWGGDVAYTPTGQEFHIEGTITYLE